MTEPGEMPRPRAERARADRWLDDRAALLAGGPVRRMVGRGRREEVDVAGGAPKPGRKGYLFDVVLDGILVDRYPPRPPER